LNALQRAVAVVALPALLGLVACGQKDAVPPSVPSITAKSEPSALPAIPASGADNSVPDAGQVLAREAAAASTPGSGEAAANQRSAVTREQESKSMPLPGQANDHSNTAGEKAGQKPARPAS
jgi:hypothetical protein